MDKSRRSRWRALVKFLSRCSRNRAHHPCVRRLAETTLRSYALDLLHFLRWWVGVHNTDAIAEAALTESTLLDYIRFQSSQQPRPAAASINRRIVVAERAWRNEFPDAPCQFA